MYVADILKRCTVMHVIFHRSVHVRGNCFRTTWSLHQQLLVRFGVGAVKIIEETLYTWSYLKWSCLLTKLPRLHKFLFSSACLKLQQLFEPISEPFKSSTRHSMLQDAMFFYHSFKAVYTIVQDQKVWVYRPFLNLWELFFQQSKKVM